MNRRSVLLAVAVAMTVGLAARQAQAPTPLAVGVEAPAFTLPSATQAGVGKAVSLLDFRGQTVVLAFFYKARTGG
jgi:cytochrome oxidase Cu insertion factor (SCO1/SenC/PrrC family)